MRRVLHIATHTSTPDGQLRRRTSVRTMARGGLQQPGDDVVRAARSISHRRSGRRTCPSTPTAATARRGRASASPSNPASGGSRGAVAYAELHCHSNFSFLDGASHPEELARGGRPARPRGPRPHRPRRVLRRGALRRGGQGHGVAHGVRGRAQPRAHRPPERRRRSRGPPPAGAGSPSRRLRPPVAGHQRGAAARHSDRRCRRQGQAGLRPRRARRRPRRRVVGAHGVPQGRGAGRAHGRRPGGRLAGPWATWWPGSGATTSPSSSGTTAIRSTRRATTRWRSWPAPTGSPWWPPTTSTTPRRPSARWPPPWRRCGRAGASMRSTAGSRPR